MKRIAASPPIPRLSLTIKGETKIPRIKGHESGGNKTQNWKNKLLHLALPFVFAN